LNFNDVSNAQTQEVIPAGSEIALSGLTCDSNVSGCFMLLLKAELVGLAVFLTLAHVKNIFSHSFVNTNTCTTSTSQVKIY